MGISHGMHGPKNGSASISSQQLTVCLVGGWSEVGWVGPIPISVWMQLRWVGLAPRRNIPPICGFGRFLEKADGANLRERTHFSRHPIMELTDCDDGRWRMRGSGGRAPAHRRRAVEAGLRRAGGGSEAGRRRTSSIAGPARTSGGGGRRRTSSVARSSSLSSRPQPNPNLTTRSHHCPPHRNPDLRRGHRCPPHRDPRPPP